MGLGVFLWIVLAAIVGARAFHVLSNLQLLQRTIRDRWSLSGTGALVVRWLFFAVPTASC